MITIDRLRTCRYSSKDELTTSKQNPKKSTGQLGDKSSTKESVAPTKESERGEQTASNIRYGQAISESGFGGKTEGGLGKADPTSNDQKHGSNEGNTGRNIQGYDGNNETSDEVGA